MPEWKKAVLGGSKGGFGKKTDLSILEQRQSSGSFGRVIWTTLVVALVQLIRAGCLGGR